MFMFMQQTIIVVLNMTRLKNCDVIELVINVVIC
jgi:hypothetical protein